MRNRILGTATGGALSMMRCDQCEGSGYEVQSDKRNHKASDFCEACNGVGYLDVPSGAPCPGIPGTNIKIAYLAARYRDQSLLWHAKDAREMK